MRRIGQSRRGFTLLEVMLASIIAVIMMAALYVAIEVQLREMEEGRAAVEQSTLTRALCSRIRMDLMPSLAPAAPTISNSAGAVSGATPGGSTSGGQMSSGQSGGPGSPSGGSSSSPTSGTESPEGVIEEAPPVKFSVGVRGDSTRIAVFVTRLEGQVISPPDDGTVTPSPLSDVRRITYFLVPDRGLARQEVRLVTSDAVDSDPYEVDELTTIIAEEVVDFQLAYFDGSSWQTSWEGSETSADGSTPKGPPRAIEILLSLREASGRIRDVRHVIALPAAAGDASSDGDAQP